MTFSLYGLIVGLATVVVWLSAEYLLKSHSGAKKWPESTWNWGLLFVGGGALIGARLYHVLTDWQLYAADPWPGVVAVWQGGLGWYGGLVGIAVGAALWRRLQKPPVPWLTLGDCVALALPWGQALGRWGNYFNQEIFGPPTDLPWGIFIEQAHRPEPWQNFERFHPLFLYESLGSLVIGTSLFLIWRWNLHRGSKHAWPTIGSGAFLGLYGIGFGCLRFSLDFLRNDLHSLGLFTVSQWCSLALIGGSLLLLSRSFRLWIGKLALVLFFVAGFSAWPLQPLAQVQAQTKSPIDLAVVPSVVEFNIQPGKSVTRAFTIRNNGTTDLNATLSIVDFVSDNRTGTPVITGPSDFAYANLANSDIRFGEKFPLPAGGEQQLVVSLNIPEDAQERDWYLVLLTSTEPQQVDPLLSSQASSRGAIGATLMVRISRQETIPLQWGLKFPTLPRFFDSLRPLVIEPEVSNFNPSMAVPELFLTVRNWRGQLMYSQEGLPERVLANSQRFIRARKTSQEDPRSLEPTEFRFDPLFALGRYTVEGRIANQAGEALVYQQTVWALPFSLIVVFSGIVIASLFWRLTTRRHRIQKSEKLT